MFDRRVDIHASLLSNIENVVIHFFPIESCKSPQVFRNMPSGSAIAACDLNGTCGKEPTRLQDAYRMEFLGFNDSRRAGSSSREEWLERRPKKSMDNK